MAKKAVAILLMVLLMGSAPAVGLASDAFSSGTASFLVPGLGQYLNGEHETSKGKTKISLMALAEVGAILTTSIVGATVGYPQIWSGIGIFIANHAYSAYDAITNASEGPTVHVSGSRAR